MSMTPCPGICRHCGCSDARPCRLEDNEPCAWVDIRRTVCSNPSCQIAERARIRRLEAAVIAARPKRRTPADVHAEMKAERKLKRREARERKVSSLRSSELRRDKGAA